MATYTGFTARLYGVVLGSLLATVGVGACLYFVVTFGLIPPALQQVLVEVTPLTDSTVGPTPRRTVPLALFVVLSLATAVMGLYGLSEVARALFRSDYSIELTVGGGTGGEL